MIEVIYNKEETKDSIETNGIKLPKNIRQIGEPGNNKKIYIEDYVVTYLSQLALPSNTYSRGAILLGSYKRVESGQVLFISGALEAQNLELDLDETIFTNETWANIYDSIKNFFPELEVVGWFLSRLGFSTELNDKIVKTHLDNFSGQHKTLYMIDSLEGEDAFYLYENGGLKKQRGYYIYYEKNEAMQNYMIDCKGVKSVDMPKEKSKVIRKDEALIKSYRSVISERKKFSPAKKASSFVYVASTFFTIAVLAVGITVVNNYDKMKMLEKSVSEMSIALNEARNNGEGLENTEEVLNVNATVSEESTTETSSEGTTISQESTTQEPPSNATTEEKVKNKKPSKQSKKDIEKSLPTATKGAATYYTVKDGDTLMGISKKMYSSSKYVTKIMESNDLSATDTIFPGQKIIIPSVN